MGGGYKTGGKGDTLTVTARVSNSASRYAMPSPIVSDFVYAALLYEDGASPVAPQSEDFVKGTKADDSDKLVFSFQRPDETEGLTLEVFAFKAGTTTFSKDNALLSGKKTGLKVSGDKIEVLVTIALSVYEKSKEKGTVSLQIKVPDECLLDIDDEANFNCVQKDGDVYTLEQNGTDIFAGVYQVTFTVKKVNETDNTKEEIIHIFTERINVLPGMRTDTWWNGATPSATKEITQDIVSTTVYVRGKDGWYETSDYKDTAVASDDNSGSFLAPLATIQKAVDTIIARNDGTSDYTICIDGTLDGTTAEYIGTNGMADFSALAQKLNLTIKALSGTATLDGGARFDADGNVVAGKEGIKSRIIYVSSSGVCNLALENLTVTGGNLGSLGTGGGITLSGGTLKIGDGTTISGNKAFYGGGVYVHNGAFTMKSGKISDNKATYGGGVYVNLSTFTMESGTISDCKAESGGGVYVTNDGTFTMKNDSTITANTASNYGGGEISNCTASSYGGGVYISSTGTFNMSGTAKIAGCKTTSTDTDTGGGGIYNEGTLTVTGGEISENYAKAGGGGIYNLLSSSSQTCSITLTNVKIFKNKTDSVGGGMYNRSFQIGKIPLMTLNGGTVVSENDAVYGGGVYDMSGGLTLNGATVSQNTATSNRGGDVYAEYRGSSLNFSGTTFVGDLYLDRKSDGDSVPRQITVHPDLACASGKTVCATITLPDDQYVPGTKILQAAGDGTMEQAVCDKFAVSKDEWKIVLNDDGKAGVLGTSAVYVNSESGDDLNSGLTASNAVQTLSKAVELFDSQYAQKIMVCAEYTLPSDESEDGLLDRMGEG